MSKYNWYAWLKRELTSCDITIAEFKNNPRDAFLKSKAIRKWLTTAHKDNYNNEIRWYNKPYKFSDHLTDVEWHMDIGNLFNHPYQITFNILLTDTTTETPTTPEDIDEPRSSKEADSTSETQEEAPPTKKQRINPQQGVKRPNEDSESPLDTNKKVNPGTTDEAQPIAGNASGNNHQVDTPTGPAHNTGGTLQGEAGNRKIQQPIERYGVLQVIMNASNNHSPTSAERSNLTYIFCFDHKVDANDLADIVEMMYPSADIACKELEFDVKDEKFSYFITCVQLGFRIKYSTLQDKIGKTTVDSLKYLQRQPISVNMNNKDKFWEQINNNLNLCFRKELPSVHFATEIQKEQSYNSSRGGNSGEPPVKRARW